MIMTCEVCNINYRVNPYRAATSRFCSRVCQGISKRNRIVAVCLGCGKKIECEAAEGRRMKYCSRSCMILSKFGVEYIIDPLTECWNWQRSKRRGYGRARRQGWESTSVHRALWIEKNGPIPDGLVLDHIICDNKSCVNPDHLKPATNKENCDRAERIQAARRSLTCRNGHLWTPKTTYMNPLSGRVCRICTLEAQRRYQDRKART